MSEPAADTSTSPAIHVWLVEFLRSGKWEEVGEFAAPEGGRPAITVGDGWFRVRGLEKERWLSSEGVTEVRMQMAALFNLVEVLMNWGEEELQEVARNVRDAGYRPAAEVLDQAINYREVLVAQDTKVEVEQ